MALDGVGDMPNSFSYKYDFDKNGALFYLGTKGGLKTWKNPHLQG